MDAAEDDAPYFLDNGAYTDLFDADAYYEMIDRALTEMPTTPDFFVLPDVYGDAEATIASHHDWLYDRSFPIGSGELMRYWVLQPGLSLEEQFGAIEGCQGVFVGGPKRWKRAYGSRIVALAEERGLRTHVGNPGGRAASSGRTGPASTAAIRPRSSRTDTGTISISSRTPPAKFRPARIGAILFRRPSRR